MYKNSEEIYKNRKSILAKQLWKAAFSS
jgi:hypothetical protein